MNGTNIKFMDIFKFLTFMLIYKRKIKLVHRKLKQWKTSATKYFGEQQQQRNFTFIAEDQKSRSKLIFVVPILRVENFEKVMDYLYTHQLKKHCEEKHLYIWQLCFCQYI